MLEKLQNWWKKKTLKDKIFFILFSFLVFLFLSWKNLIPYKITVKGVTTSPIGDEKYYSEKWYWLGKEL